MADFLTAVKTAGTETVRPEAAVLTEISTRTTRQPTSVKVDETSHSAETQQVHSPEDALVALKSQPDSKLLTRTLKQLKDGFPGSEFDIHTPGPLQAQILNTLIGLTVPTFGPVLDGKDQALLLDCLRSVAGSNAVVSRLQLLSDQASEPKLEELKTVLSVAKELFKNDDFAFRIWTELPSVLPTTKPFQSDTKRQLAWREFVGLIASGKVITAFARAEDIVKSKGRTIKASWQSGGAEFAAWLGRNVTHFLTQTVEGKDTISGTKAAVAQLFARAFSLSYHVPLVKGLLGPLVTEAMSSQAAAKAWSYFVKMLPAHTKRQLSESTLRWLNMITEDGVMSELAALENGKDVSPVAAVICFVAESDVSMGEQLLVLLQDPVFLSSVNFVVRHASVAFLAARSTDDLQTLLERSMATFGDHLFITHAPIRQQECLAQTLLLSAGYLHRIAPLAVLTAARSPSHLHGVSNRLDSTNQKARWLGMVVGTVISGLVDKENSKMSFGTEEMHTIEAERYKRLTTLRESMGTLNEFDKFLKSKDGAIVSRKKTHAKLRTHELPVLDGKQTFGPPRPPRQAQAEVTDERVTEVWDEEEEDAEDLKPYAKPDSDTEDSDEDATLVNRNKSSPPVYVRDLMRMLKDDKDHDRFQLAVKHAPALIRRKANFGGEVQDHAEELALIFCNLQDPFDTDDFDELRLQALIAVLLSDVKTIAPRLSKEAFAGDYGLAQRCIMLSALGLGGIELAGLNDQKFLDPPVSAGFPSQRLPVRLHALYSPSDNSARRLHAASERAQHQLMKPLALSAADEATSHLNTVKVRTFSSRMNIERIKRKPTANELAKVFGKYFFFPLVTRYQQDIAAYGAGSVFKSAPYVLTTFIKTLALLLNASGPATLDLADITTVFWDTLLSLRVQAGSDISVLGAVLFSLLTLLEVNQNAKERLGRENFPQLVQTQPWVETIFERVGGGERAVEGNGDEDNVRALAAGVLVWLAEVVEEKKKVLVGSLP